MTLNFFFFFSMDVEVVSLLLCHFNHMYLPSCFCSTELLVLCFSFLYGLTEKCIYHNGKKMHRLHEESLFNLFFLVLELIHDYSFIIVKKVI